MKMLRKMPTSGFQSLRPEGCWGSTILSGVDEILIVLVVAEVLRRQVNEVSIFQMVACFDTGRGQATFAVNNDGLNLLK